MWISEQQRSHSSPKPTLILTCYHLIFVGLGEGTLFRNFHEGFETSCATRNWQQFTCEYDLYSSWITWIVVGFYSLRWNLEPWKINLSPWKVLEKSLKFVSEIGYEPRWTNLPTCLLCAHLLLLNVALFCTVFQCSFCLGIQQQSLTGSTCESSLGSIQVFVPKFRYGEGTKIDLWPWLEFEDEWYTFLCRSFTVKCVKIIFHLWKATSII